MSGAIFKKNILNKPIIIIMLIVICSVLITEAVLRLGPGQRPNGNIEVRDHAEYWGLVGATYDYQYKDIDFKGDQWHASVHIHSFKYDDSDFNWTERLEIWPNDNGPSRIRIDDKYTNEAKMSLRLVANGSKTDGNSIYELELLNATPLRGTIRRPYPYEPQIELWNCTIKFDDQVIYLNGSHPHMLEVVSVGDTRLTIYDPLEGPLNAYHSSTLDLEKATFHGVVGTLHADGGLLISLDSTPGSIKVKDPKVRTIELEHGDESYSGSFTIICIPASEWIVHLEGSEIIPLDNFIFIPYYLIGLFNSMIIIIFYLLLDKAIKAYHEPWGNVKKGVRYPILFASWILVFLVHMPVMYFSDPCFLPDLGCIACCPVYIVWLSVLWGISFVMGRLRGIEYVITGMGVGFILFMVDFSLLGVHELNSGILLPLGLSFLILGGTTIISRKNV